MNYTVPGIYAEPEPKRIDPISITNRCLAGFVGITEKGPLNKGVKITGFNQYQKIFGGFTNYGYLAHAVFGFFNSGGKECVIVRVAHFDKYDERNSVAKAYYDCNDVYGNKFFKLQALTEGSFANNYQVKLWHVATNSMQVTNISHEADWQQWIEVEDGDAFSIGDRICLRDGLDKEYRKIVKIENNCLHLNEKFSKSYNVTESNTFCELIRFNLIVMNGNDVEEYVYLSTNPDNEKYYLKVINKKSKLVSVVEENDAIMPDEIYFKNMYNGRNGVLGLTAADFIGHYKGLNDHKGMGVFESFDDISVIAAPDAVVFDEVVHNNDKEKSHSEIHAIQSAMVDQCERIGNRFAILDLPKIDDILEVLKWRNKYDTSVAAMYYPSIQMVNPEDITSLSTVYVPPSGHVAGVYALCDAEEGIYRAPANKILKGVVGTSRNVDDQEYEITYSKGLNCMRYFPGQGLKVWGARTLSSDVNWRYINVRRTFSAIKDSIKDGMGWAVFEPNDNNLRKRIVRHVTAFLLDLWRKGYMSGVVPEDGFYVRCDDEINPPEEIQLGRINVEIGIAIARPAEYLVMTFKSDSEDMMIYDDE